VTIRLVAPPRPHAANTVSNTSRIRTIPSVTVVIPAFNEAAVIAEVIADLRDTLGQNADIVVVDDGSSDGTVLKAIEAGARVVSAPYNTGNGAAVKSGIRAATGEFVAIMDGDGQHKASDLLKLLDFAGPYDMVVGARDPKTQASSLRRRVARSMT
jgi:glycosyltransferase involved in cell wall biosynthesis